VVVGSERARSSWWDRLLDPVDFARRVEAEVQPAWRRFTEGESRIPVTIAISVAIALQLLLANRVANHPKWVLPALALLLLVGIVAANPKRLDHQSRALRGTTLLLIAVMSLANVASAARLIIDLIRGEGIHDPGDLLLAGGAIWLTNVIVFALWYWMFDRGGPVARLLVGDTFPDFLFPQLTCDPEQNLVRPGWKPDFFDYLYMSFTNATAFSPTDVMPMSRWAKLTMMLQSAVALLLAILVIARAVNVLK
jgi:uncharacterized membrane protein